MNRSRPVSSQDKVSLSKSATTYQCSAAAALTERCQRDELARHVFPAPVAATYTAHPTPSRVAVTFSVDLGLVATGENHPGPAGHWGTGVAWSSIWWSHSRSGAWHPNLLGDDPGVCRLIMQRKGMDVSVSSGHQPALSVSMSWLSSKASEPGCQAWRNQGLRGPACESRSASSEASRRASRASNRHRPGLTSPARACWWEAPRCCSSLLPRAAKSYSLVPLS